MNIIAAVAKRAGLIREAESLADQVTRTIDEQRAAIVAKRAEIAETRDAWPPADELIATAERLVDEEAARWWEKNERGFLQGLAGNRIPGYDDDVRRLELPFPGFKPMPFDSRCALEADTIKAMLRAGIVSRARSYAAGLPAAARPARLEQLTGELAALEANEEAAVDALIEKGVGVAHRFEVVQRRQAEQAQRERTARVAAMENRPAREAAVDQRHERRVVRSSYLNLNRRHDA